MNKKTKPIYFLEAKYNFTFLSFQFDVKYEPDTFLTGFMSHPKKHKQYLPKLHEQYTKLTNPLMAFFFRNSSQPQINVVNFIVRTAASAV